MRPFSRDVAASSLTLALVLGSPLLAAADPYGDPFRVNDVASGDQSALSVAVGANGDAAMVWVDGSSNYLARYDGAGHPLQQRALSLPGGVTDVAVSGAGSFVTLREVQNGIGRDIYATVYDRSGRVVTSEFLVNDPTGGQRNFNGSKVAMNAAGQFVVAYQRWAVSGSGSLATDLFVKRYQSNGVPIGSAMYIRAAPSRILADDVGLDDQGNFVVIWNELTSPSTANLYGWRFVASGGSSSSAFLIATSQTQLPHLSMNGSGAFAVSTTSPVSASTWSTFAWRYNRDTSLLAGPLLVSTQPGDPQCTDVGIGADGGFSVTWQEGTGQNPGPVLVRSFDPRGTANSSVTTANASNGSGALYGCPKVGVAPSGDSWVSWTQRVSPTSPDGADAFARRYMPGGVLVTPLANQQTITNLAGAAGSWTYYKVQVLPGQTTLDVTMSGNSGDADLYLRWGALPTATSWDGRPYIAGSNEAVRMSNFPAGDWYVGVNGYTSYSGVTLQPHAY